jgi:pimeloyl-ACP methyl ester carboxylesterase
MPFRPLVAVLGLGLIALAASGAADSSRHQLRWHKCPGGECASLDVPLDYSNRAGRTIEVALFRIKAKDPKRRIGSLLFNPGGPGDSGVAFLRDNGPALSGKLSSRFDLIGFDPRGTGRTSPVRCGRSFGRLLDRNLVPTTAAERRAAGAAYSRFARVCKRRLGRVLGHIATVDTARDMDRIRAALGEERVSYVGYSYGTFLGQAYANMFPKRVRAMVIDGVENASLDPIHASLAEAKSVERSLDAFLKECAADASCAFHGDGQPAAAFDRLAAGVQANPIPVGNRRLGPTQFWFGVLFPLYSGDDDVLATALASAAKGNGSALLKGADQVTGRRPNGTYGTSPQAEQAIDCLDGKGLGRPARFPALEARFHDVAPRAGRFVLYSEFACSYWPEKPRPPKRPVRAPGAAPILVVGTTGDPVTPYGNAVAVARRLDSGILITNDGNTHTAVSALGGPCDGAVIPYLVKLLVPKRGRHCTKGN